MWRIRGGMVTEMSLQFLPRIALLLLASFCCSCGITARYGDARLRDNPDFLFPTVGNFWFPPFPIDRPGHYEFVAKNLPRSWGSFNQASAFPHRLYFRVKGMPRKYGRWKDQQWASQPPQAPWAAVRIKVKMIDSAGNLLFDKVIGPGSRPYDLETDLGLDMEKILKAGRPSNYRVLVTVITPSPQEGDRAFLGAHANEEYRDTVFSYPVF
jgi:hypothetical protein